MSIWDTQCIIHMCMCIRIHKALRCCSHICSCMRRAERERGLLEEGGSNIKSCVCETKNEVLIECMRKTQNWTDHWKECLDWSREENSELNSKMKGLWHTHQSYVFNFKGEKKLVSKEKKKGEKKNTFNFKGEKLCIGRREMLANWTLQIEASRKIDSHPSGINMSNKAKVDASIKISSHYRLAGQMAGFVKISYFVPPKNMCPFLPLISTLFPICETSPIQPLFWLISSFHH